MRVLSTRFALVACCAALSATAVAQNDPQSFDCPVTIASDPRGLLDSEGISTTLWSAGVVIFAPDGPGFIQDDGSMAMKWPWVRHVEGELTVDGRRLDAKAAPLGAELEPLHKLPVERSKTGFLSSMLVFPTPGCWEVTGRLGDHSLTFVTMVVDLCRYMARSLESCQKTTSDMNAQTSDGLPAVTGG